MDWDFGDVLLTMLVFFFWVLFISMFISAFMDIFRRRDLSGWGKAGWTLLICIAPFLGILIYMVARPRLPMDDYAQSAVGGGAGGRGYSSADEIAKLAELREKGTISDEEFQRLKARTVG
jgi:hypothetical protein